MNRVLKVGLCTGGAGVAFLLLSMIGGFGPCGPETPIGLVVLLAALLCLPAGLTMFLCGMAILAVKRVRRPATPEHE